MLEIISRTIVSFGDWIWGMPLFLLLMGGGLFFLVYSGFVPFRYYGKALEVLGKKDDTGAGQISSFEALTSAIASTVGMGSISGVAIALSMGGAGAIFWMWVSAVVGMATKFFEGTLAVMYKGRDSSGEVQGGTMYMITQGLGRRWKPMAVFFSLFGLVGTLSLMQANQLTEAVTTIFIEEDSTMFRVLVGIVICVLVSVVILGGIVRISKVASRLVPAMVSAYFLLVGYIIITNLSVVPAVFAQIFSEAFTFSAGIGGLAGSAMIIGARRAIFVNEAGVGTASMMHGASKNSEPIREGLVAMIGPSIDSGLVCTLTALAILIGGYNATDVKGIQIALQSFQNSIPILGHYLLMVMVVVFAFSTMFTYSYYGAKCTNFLFGARAIKYYNYFYLLMLIVGAVMPLRVMIGIVDSAFALMAIPSMVTLLLLAPKVKKAAKVYFGR